MAAAAHYILGLDLGTTSVKACLIDSHSLKVLAKQSKDTQAGEGAEQDISKIIAAVHICIGRIPRDLLKNVVRIGICGQMHGVLLWNRETAWTQAESSSSERYELGKGPFSPLYTWQDDRCTPEFLASLPKPRSHLRIATGYGCVTLLWKLMEEDHNGQSRSRPEDSLDFYSCAGTVQDFLVAMLCDLEKPIMSIQNAASWGYFDTRTKEWNLDLLSSVNFPVHLLPDVVDPGHVAGRLSKLWYGIPRGTEVLVALGDMQCSVLSILSSEVGNTAVLNMSTSAQLSLTMPAGFSPPDSLSAIEYFPYFNNRYLAVAASLNGGNVMASFVRMLQSWMHDLGFGVPQGLIWDKMLSLVKSAESSLPQGNGGGGGTGGGSGGGGSPRRQPMVITPTLFGERHLTDRPAGAQVTNITPANVSLGNVAQALFDGLITNLHNMMPSETLQHHGVTQLVGTGSALNRNPPLQDQVKAKYANIPFKTVQDGDAAFGAALAALN